MLAVKYFYPGEVVRGRFEGRLIIGWQIDFERNLWRYATAFCKETEVRLTRKKGIRHEEIVPDPDPEATESKKKCWSERPVIIQTITSMDQYNKKTGRKIIDAKLAESDWRPLPQAIQDRFAAVVMEEEGSIEDAFQIGKSPIEWLLQFYAETYKYLEIEV